MKPLIQLKQRTSVFLIAFGLACFGLSPAARAVTPPPDGGYPNENTAEGTDALLHLSFNNVGGNTAIGFEALKRDTDGVQNTAVGDRALSSDTVGNFNTAVGLSALGANQTGSGNTAIGWGVLGDNTGNDNTAAGLGALFNNHGGHSNTAVGEEALQANTHGSNNVALGFQAGSNATTGSNNVYIGAGINGIAGESNACRIASIFGQTAANGSAVFITSGHKLGTATSSKRFKENINPMNRASEVIFSLKPVAFRYKKEIDPERIPQFGLVAEDVEKVNPDLIVRDQEGKPYSVRYDQVNAMLLNEFLKEHRTVQGQQKEIDALKTELKEQKALIQKVSAQIESSKPAPRVVNNP